MIEKITIDELLDEIYSEQIELIRDSDLSSKDKQERKEKIRNMILEVETMEELLEGLANLNYSSHEAYEYILSFFVDS